MGDLLVLLALVGIALVVASPIAAVAAIRHAERLRLAVRDLHRQLDSVRREVRELRLAARETETSEPPATPEVIATPEVTATPDVEPPETEEAEPGLRWEPVTEEASEPGPSRPAPAPPHPAPSLEAMPGRVELHRPAKSNVEEQLSVRLPVWIGAVSLVLAVVFLVKYTFDQGLLTPAVRLGVGSIFGIGLIGASELLLRSARFRLPGDWIPHGLCAAGLGILYACLFGAVSVYRLVDPTLGFGLMVGVTAAAVLLSTRHGPIVATVGLIGGFLMPALIPTNEPKAAVLFSYLFVLEGGLVTLTSRRGWWWIGALTLVASIVWAALWVSGIVAGGLPDEQSVWVGLFLVGSSLAFALPRTPPESAGTTAGRATVALVWVAAIAGLALLGTLSHHLEYSTRQWCFLGTLGAGFLALGRLDPTKEALPFLPALTGLVLLCAWQTEALSPSEHERFGWTALGYGGLHAVGAYALLWGARRPALWCLLTGLSLVSYFVVAYAALSDVSVGIGWGGLSLVLAALSASAARPLLVRRTTLAQGPLAVSVLAATAVIFVFSAAPIELEREWIGVSWALLVATMAWTDRWLDLPIFRLLAALVALAISALLLNRTVLEHPIGPSFPWNWLLYGYGIPAVALAWAATVYRKLDLRRLAMEPDAQPLPRLLGILSILLGLALVALQVRQYFHPGQLAGHDYSVVELATHFIASTLYGLLILESWSRLPWWAVLRGGTFCGVLGLGSALLVLGLPRNPVMTGEPVGEAVIWNDLLYVYGLPATAGLLLARKLRRLAWWLWARVAGISSILLLLLLVSLEVRQGFQGARLNGAFPTNAEWYAYSAAWIVFGLILLIVGIASRSLVARYASLLVVMASAAKVFVFDMRELRNLYRVVSFLGLGVSLFLLSYLYQRFVFRRTDGRPRVP